MKVKMIVAAVAVAGLTATAANAADNGKLQLQISQLKAQQTQLQQQVANLQGQGQTTGAVHVGAVGGELISENNYDGRGLDLLKSLAKAGSNAPLLTIGGTLEADAQMNRNGNVGSGSTSGDPSGLNYTDGTSSSAFYLDTARIDILAHINDWVNGEIAYDLNGDSGLHTGSLLVGNLNQLPVYGQIGKFYPDAGLFELASDDVYSASLVKRYFRPDAQNGASVGFYKAGLHTSLTAFKTSTEQSNVANYNQATSDWSAQADYTFNAGQVNATIGAGYLSNMVNTNDSFTATGAGTGSQKDRLPMANVSAKIGFGPFEALATYAQTLKGLANTTGGGTTKLKAFDLEGAYHFQAVKPMTVMLGYSRTYGFDKVGPVDQFIDGNTVTTINNKKDQWLLGVNSEVFKNTTVGLEYARVGQLDSTGTDTNRYNVLTADMTVKF
ncbi:LbtU family siderophore porin [Piscirickettsia salmonis]|uniref:Exported protein n=2 Tax=Piscirickettsia salmonis TaxID=1238 RepID=A0AAC8VF17_PISSA|nr:LbtU family siderophore porin [Piscirickettsia salmonis]AKP74740.1 hypothetical protein PSLF89_3252 [Piscirickettsia salmonis LF-89 = ATCC VR-1361]ALB21334.1 exported protein [Piscirickettsia salmonis]ALY01575.1 hypothetical protein AWE47_00730 [Piscirickettsia salmonis]AMA41087.1 hypothetical protein AWJ11_00735 [Piscirickettsia salmonis]AOS36276.1 hypothetical protein AVM72_13725 [Piscirickettsia salmonis]